MSVVLKSVLQSAMALPEADRVQLVDALIATLPHDEQMVFDDSFLSEVEQRCDEVEAGTANTISWEEVKARVHGRLNDA